MDREPAHYYYLTSKSIIMEDRPSIAGDKYINTCDKEKRVMTVKCFFDETGKEYAAVLQMPASLTEKDIKIKNHINGSDDYHTAIKIQERN